MLNYFRPPHLPQTHVGRCRFCPSNELSDGDSFSNSNSHELCTKCPNGTKKINLEKDFDCRFISLLNSGFVEKERYLSVRDYYVSQFF